MAWVLTPLLSQHDQKQLTGATSLAYTLRSQFIAEGSLGRSLRPKAQRDAACWLTHRFVLS